VQTELVDVKVDARIVADEVGGQHAGETNFTYEPPTSPHYTADHLGKGKILKFERRLTWHTTVTIKTTYPVGSDPDQLSGYGRGTKKEDSDNGDITLGFHEQCHRDDYERYLKSHPLPDPPKLHVGMTVAELTKTQTEFNEKVKAYFESMRADSVSRTDEVGYRRSTYKRTKIPYRHTLPAE
jgi:hypothetical protein